MNLQNQADKIFDVLGIGSSIVDIGAHCSEEFLKGNSAEKGTMQLVNEKEIVDLTEKISISKKTSGGSAANTVASIALLGGHPAFIGKTNNDELGNFFAENIIRSGVYFDTKPLLNSDATARCIVLVTPDAERTMFTYLGASGNLDISDIDQELIQKSKILYLEGYQWDVPEAKSAIVEACKIAKNCDTQVALSLSDPFVVDRHRSSLLFLIESEIDILFANEYELISLFESDNFDDAIASISGKVHIANITRGSQGSTTIHQNGFFNSPSFVVKDVIDTTGAGDIYAAGFLYGFVNRYSLEDSARLGNLMASEIISHIGARPEQSLSSIAKSYGF